MCCCDKPTINGEQGYKWNNPNGPSGVYPINPPSLSEGDEMLADEPGRCGGSDSHSHHYRLVKSSGGSLSLLVKHGGGEERLRLSGPMRDTLLSLDSTTRYWLLNTIYHAYAEGRQQGQARATNTWRQAAAEKRIRTRKQRGSDSVKVWIEYATMNQTGAIPARVRL